MYVQSHMKQHQQLLKVIIVYVHDWHVACTYMLVLGLQFVLKVKIVHLHARGT